MDRGVAGRLRQLIDDHMLEPNRKIDWASAIASELLTLLQPTVSSIARNPTLDFCLGARLRSCGVCVTATS